ncbi:MAG TPA: DUF177 domain-containing protein [Blastocatellia bacterium]|nr:DUF177 domain-containing protein [Blastocatellia bacterium]
MIINVTQISEDEGLDLTHLYPEGEPALAGGEIRIVGSPSLKLHASREDDRVNLTGSVSAKVQLDCDRCLKPLYVDVDQSFDLEYIPSGSITASERVLGQDDLMTGFYLNQLIDLDDVVREQIELSLPMSRLCNDECKGLCGICGARLNDEPCTCGVDNRDPRWEALRELKIND